MLRALLQHKLARLAFWQGVKDGWRDMIGMTYEADPTGWMNETYDSGANWGERLKHGRSSGGARW